MKRRWLNRNRGKDKRINEEKYETKHLINIDDFPLLSLKC